jgi:catechol 2,3-dioxygenase-like lactoylglutathione lyase family enzyme
MSQVKGIDHVAITVADLEVACVFYRDLLGAQPVNKYAPNGKVLVRQVLIGGAQFSIHQAGNGVALVALHATGSGIVWQLTPGLCADELYRCAGPVGLIGMVVLIRLKTP